jgi:hypothetical protein
VRDHTTDQLNPEGDEYIPREFDDAGEKKVALNGAPLGERDYKCRTFYVPNRGDKLFMLATECARVLGYRDSYLLFNKNRSLHKIIANQTEKDDLISQEILPYSYRSRQIAIVTARSMFRQFGSRLIVNGRRVRDDYWEAKARKQGFTEEDAAGEKRPGAAKQRMAEAQAEASNVSNLTLPQGDVRFVHDGRGPSLPMITQSDDIRSLDYTNVQRPRQEIAGQAYQDRTQPSAGTEIIGHAQQTSEFNRNISLQRAGRSPYLDDLWRRPHDPPVSSAQQQRDGEITTSSSQALHSPQQPTAGGIPGQQNMPHQQQGHPSQIMTSHTYPQQPHPQAMVAQSPVRPMHQQQIPGQPMHQRSPSMVQHNPQGYGNYPQQQHPMWPPAQPQPSPLSQQHPSMQAYTQHIPSPSPHMQPSPLHAGPPQLHHSSSTGSLQGAQMSYQGMGGMNQPNYQNVRQQMYQQPNQNHQQYMQQSTATTQPGMQGWAPGPPQQQHGQQPGGWQQGF